MRSAPTDSSTDRFQYAMAVGWRISLGLFALGAISWMLRLPGADAIAPWLLVIGLGGMVVVLWKRPLDDAAAPTGKASGPDAAQE